VTQLKEAERSRMTASTRIMLSHAIRALESGRVKFHRTGGPAKGQPRWTIEYRSQCRTCQGDRWQAIEMNCAAWVACAQSISEIAMASDRSKAG
jgi:hypothetical protein